jgi:hypothetical protein
VQASGICGAGGWGRFELSDGEEEWLAEVEMRQEEDGRVEAIAELGRNRNGYVRA